MKSLFRWLFIGWILTAAGVAEAQVYQYLTNRSGGALAKGSVVIIDTSLDKSFTTTTTLRKHFVLSTQKKNILRKIRPVLSFFWQFVVA